MVNDWYKIQDAIDNASSGNTLHIWAWTYNENVIVDETVTIVEMQQAIRL